MRKLLAASLLPLLLLAGCAGGVTSQSCLQALDGGDAILGMFGEATDSASTSLTAAGSFDSATLRNETVKMQALADRLGPVLRAYKADSAACRAGRP